MASLPTVVIKGNEFHIDAATPCRFIFLIPLDLPPLLDPSIPPPPYLVAGAVDQPRMRDAVGTALRPAVVGALHELLGTEAPVSAMIPRENADWGQREPYDSRILAKGFEFDAAAGFWVDQYGNKGGEAPAWSKFGEFTEVIEAYKFRVNQCIVDSESNPLVVELRAMPVLHGKGAVAWVVKKYSEWEQREFNHAVWRDMEPC
jgi:hypothetical protein